jgi:hypothetical protein
MTIIGNGTKSNTGDGGQASSATIGISNGLCFDQNHNLIFSDTYFSVIRKINKTSNIVTTIAGNGIGYSGDGGPAIVAMLNSPGGLMTYSSNLYISDAANNRVRVVTCNTGSSCITGLKKQTKINSFMIYPNPATNLLYITDETNFEKAECEIVNYLGQTVLKQIYSNSIDVSKLADGIYTLKITLENNQNYFSKFIKE